MDHSNSILALHATKYGFVSMHQPYHHDVKLDRIGASAITSRVASINLFDDCADDRFPAELSDESGAFATFYDIQTTDSAAFPQRAIPYTPSGR